MNHLTENSPDIPSPVAGDIHIGPARKGSFTNEDLDLLGWEIPSFLRALYRQAHGVGPWDGGWLPYSFLPWEAVEPLTRRIRFGEENVCFDPADGILVVRDGSGGGWVLQGRDHPVWRRFDGTDHTLGPPLSDWAAVADIVRHWVG